MRLKGLIYPRKDELDLGLAMVVTEGGETYVSRKGVPSLTLVRMFARVRNEDFEALKNWHTDVSEGSRNTFTFIDDDGVSHTVRWTNGLPDWQRDAENQWSGVMTLRVENFEP